MRRTESFMRIVSDDENEEGVELWEKLFSRRGNYDFYARIKARTAYTTNGLISTGP